MEIIGYLDPGSASALLAAILAGIAGIGAAIRTYGKNFMSRLIFWKKDPVEPGDGPSATPETGDDEPAEPR